MSDLEITRWRTFKLMAWPLISSAVVAIGVLWMLNHITPVGPTLIFLGGIWVGAQAVGEAIKKGIREMIQEELGSSRP